jgi:FdhE protein
MPVADEHTLLLDRRVAAWTAARPERARELACQGQLIRQSVTSVRPPVAQPFAVPREHVAARVHEGVPLLYDQPLRLDVEFASGLFKRLLSVLVEHVDDSGTLARLTDMRDAQTSGRLDPDRLFGEAFVQHADHLAEIAHELKLDLALLASLSVQAVAPLLWAYAERLRPMVERLDDGSPGAVVWQRGYCPICGGWPAVAEVREGDRAPVLRCRACGSGWWAQLGRCTYCGEDEPGELRALTFDNDPYASLLLCEGCRAYLKMLNVCDHSPSELLGLDDIATGFLDDVAAERGYRRPDGSGFRIELAVPDDDWPDELDDD